MGQERFKPQFEDLFFGRMVLDRIMPRNHFLVQLQEAMPWQRFSYKLARIPPQLRATRRSRADDTACGPERLRFDADSCPWAAQRRKRQTHDAQVAPRRG